MKKIFICLLFAVSFFSCDDGENHTHNEDTYDYFEKRLNANMKYDTIKALFGDPDDDIGSGIHIYVYILNDGTRIVIGYNDSIIYARHLDENNQVVDILI